MGLMVRILVVAVSLGLAVIVQNYRQMSRPMEAPKLDLQEYWGPGSGSAYKEDPSINAFDITTKPELIEDLRTQLARPLKLHEPLEGVGFEYGFNSKELANVVKYWRDTYMAKWGEREAYLKQFPHFRTQIQGLQIHFIHAKPKNTAGKRVVPLLLLHGWPGSVREFYELIPLLTAGNAKSKVVFEVIVPSLPGYGWSQGASKVHFGPAKLAVVLRNLMLRVGHKEFVVQGGDWGSLIGSNMASLFPENVIGFHSNMCSNESPISRLKMLLSRLCPRFFGEKEHSEFYEPLAETFAGLMEESGYFHIQATKPDTIGSALLRNPVGLAAYILEKFSTWTNKNFKKLADGGLTKRYSLDALLDNVMVYYVTDSITTSQRLYSEAFTKTQTSLQLDRVPLRMPTGCARFRYDLLHTPDSQLRDKFVNLVHSSYHSDGGHFAAMELPKIFYEDFVQYVEKAFETSS